MSTALTTLTSKLAAKLDMGADGSDLIETLKATAFKGEVTNAQMTALMVVANQYGLNPWTKEIYAFPDKGGIVVDAAVEPCTIAFYLVTVKPKRLYWGGYPFYVFTGRTRAGQVLGDAECRAIMELPVLRHTAHGPAIGNSNRHLVKKEQEDLDRLVSTQVYIDKVLTDSDSVEKEEIERLTARAADSKSALERGIATLRSQVKAAESDLRKGLSGLEKLKLQKQCSALTRELKQAEENLFMQRLQLDRELDEQIQELMHNAQLTANIERQFIINVSS